MAEGGNAVCGLLVIWAFCTGMTQLSALVRASWAGAFAFTISPAPVTGACLVQAIEYDWLRTDWPAKGEPKFTGTTRVKYMVEFVPDAADCDSADSCAPTVVDMTPGTTASHEGPDSMPMYDLRKGNPELQLCFDLAAWSPWLPCTLDNEVVWTAETVRPLLSRGADGELFVADEVERLVDVLGSPPEGPVPCVMYEGHLFRDSAAASAAQWAGLGASIGDALKPLLKNVGIFLFFVCAVIGVILNTKGRRRKTEGPERKTEGPEGKRTRKKKDS